MDISEDSESRTASFKKPNKTQPNLTNGENFIDLSIETEDNEQDEDHSSQEEDDEQDDLSSRASGSDYGSEHHPRLSIPTMGTAVILDGPPTKMYRESHSRDDSFDENDEVDDSIRLNLADEEKMDIISINDDENDSKSNSDDSTAVATKVEQPTGRAEKKRKTNGAISVSIGLKLGGGAKSSSALAPVPTTQAERVEIVDHTHSVATSQIPSRAQSRRSSGVTSINESTRRSGPESEEEGETDDSDDDSISSVDSNTWARQRKYYVREPSPDLLNEEGRPFFGAEMSKEDAKTRVNTNIIIDDRQKICDICQGRHKTENCENINCSVCGAINEHFSLTCPSLLKGSGLFPGKCVSCSTFDDIPKMSYCPHIWRSHPEPIHPYKKSKRIPVSCYQCGMSNDHFGDECPSLGKKGMTSTASGSPWCVSEASKWSSMGLNSKYASSNNRSAAQNGSWRDPIPVASDDEEDEASWFETRLKAAKEKVPDSDLTGRPMTANAPNNHPRSKKKPFQRDQGRDYRRQPPPKDYGDDIRGRARQEPTPRFRRRSRSPPIQYGYPDRDHDRGHQPPPPGVSFSMRGNQYPPPPPRGNYRQGDRSQPPLPPGPPPGPSHGRDYYRPGNNSARQAWNQYQR